MTLSYMTYIHVYTYRHQCNHDHNIITRYHKFMVFQNSKCIWLLQSIHLTFLNYVSHDYPAIIHLHQWTQMIQLTIILLPSTTLIHALSFIQALPYLLVPHNSPKYPWTSTFPNQFPRLSKFKRQDKKQIRRKTWKPIKIRHHEQSGKALHQT